MQGPAVLLTWHIGRRARQALRPEEALHAANTLDCVHPCFGKLFLPPFCSQCLPQPGDMITGLMQMQAQMGDSGCSTALLYLPLAGCLQHTGAVSLTWSTTDAVKSREQCFLYLWLVSVGQNVACRLGQYNRCKGQIPACWHAHRHAREGHGCAHTLLGQHIQILSSSLQHTSTCMVMQGCSLLVLGVHVGACSRPWPASVHALPAPG